MALGSLAGLYAAGVEVTQDLTKARVLLAKSCNQGSALGCFGLGGTYVQSDPAMALTFLDKACPTVQPACDVAKALRAKKTP